MRGDRFVIVTARTRGICLHARLRLRISKPLPIYRQGPLSPIRSVSPIRTASSGSCGGGGKRKEDVDSAEVRRPKSLLWVLLRLRLGGQKRQ